MKTPSSYPVLDNRPIDQWRVTELKEELKRRKLSTKGLKDDLVRRLDEAIHEELESAKEDNGSSDDDSPQPVGHTDNVGTPQPIALDSPQPKVQTDDISVHDATPQPVVHSEKVGVLDDISQDVVNGDDDGEKNFNEKNVGMMHHGNSADSEGTYGDDSVRNVETSIPVTSVETDIERNEAILSERDVQDREGTGGVDPVRSEETLVHATSVEATSSMTVNKSVTHELAVDVQESLKDDLHGMRDDSKTEVDNQETLPHNDVESHSSEPSNRVSEVSANVDFQVTQLETESKLPHDDVKLNSSNPNNQVSVVSSVLGFQVKSDSISSDCVSINEKNELKDNIIDDNVKLELDVRPEMVNPSSSNVLSDRSEPHPMDGEEQCDNKEPVEEGDEKTANSEMSKKNESLDVISSEKLNLDRSSGDDSMEDDTLENKPTDYKHTSGVGDRGEKNEGPVLEEEAPVGMVSDDIPADKKVTADEIKKVPAVPIVKRKLHDQEGVGNNETSKRPRRWNSENLKVPETQSYMASSTTPKELFSLKRNFSKSDSTASDDAPKERVVPPSSKPPTTSLRIDQFLRPFTLKAVQELLGKTGNVTSFWMDHIKTHCYVTYSSVEEAVETRNAVYNLQWPANGGRLLLAEFVDPQEVKMRVDAPPQSPATPVSTGPTMLPPTPPTELHQATPRQQVQRQPLPPPPSLPLPPPPPLSNPPQARERLPPPPPRPEKIDPPIVTLDDLFRKTKATPRIYYLPLSDEQVAERLKAQRGRNAKQ